MSRYQRSMRDALQSVADSQIEFDEAVKWEVKITGLPTFYADGKSRGEVKTMLRKLLKRPDEIVSIERTTPAQLKMIRRGQASGVEPDEDDGEEVKEELLLEDNRIIKVKNKELTVDDIVNMIQFGKPFTVGEDIPAKLPPGDPNFPRYKDIPNSVVDKEDKKANKAKARAEKDILIPTQTDEAADTWHPDKEKDKQSTSYKHSLKITQKGLDALRKDRDRPKVKTQVKITKKGREALAKADRFAHIKVTPDQLRKTAKARQTEAVKVWTDKAQVKDKKNQNKDPVGSQHEGIVSGAGKVAGAAIGGAIGLGINPALGVATGAGIIKGTSVLQKKLDKKKADRKAERERAKVAAKAEREKKDPRLSHEAVAVNPQDMPGLGSSKKAVKTSKRVGQLYTGAQVTGEAKIKHPDAGVSLSVRRARKKKSAAQMKKDMRHVDQLSKIGAGRRKERELRDVGVRPTPKWYTGEETDKSDEKWRENFKRQATKRLGQRRREQQAGEAGQKARSRQVEVAPPGWGHTKAEKEKTKPDKPKSKIGGSAHEFKKDLDSGKFKGLPGDKTYKDKKASMFKLMWSMKNKGEKPHYKPGVKDKLKTKYKKDESVLDTAKRYLSK